MGKFKPKKITNLDDLRQ